MDKEEIASLFDSIMDDAGAAAHLVFTDGEKMECVKVRLASILEAAAEIVKLMA